MLVMGVGAVSDCETPGAIMSFRTLVLSSAVVMLAACQSAPSADPNLAALSIIAEALRTADEGRVYVRAMTLSSGERFDLVTYHLGDTLCGYILDGTDVVAVISDMRIDSPA